MRTVLLEPLSNALDTSSLNGDVTVMFGFGMHQSPSVFRTDEFKERVIDWLEKNDYDPEKDTFVVAGRLTKVALALATIVAHFPMTPIKVAIFDGANESYVERTLT